MWMRNEKLNFAAPHKLTHSIALWPTQWHVTLICLPSFSAAQRSHCVTLLWHKKFNSDDRTRESRSINWNYFTDEKAWIWIALCYSDYQSGAKVRFSWIEEDSDCLLVPAVPTPICHPVLALPIFHNMSQFLRSTHFSFIHAIKLMLIHFPFAPAQWHIRIFLSAPHHTHPPLSHITDRTREPRSKSYDIYLGHREERGGDGESWTNGIKRKLVESFEAGPKNRLQKS